MSIYRCGLCEEYKDADVHGCCAHPSNPYVGICEDCESSYDDHTVEARYLTLDTYE